MNTRLVRGFVWGVVATIAMTLVHIGIWAGEGRLTIHAMATQMMPAIIIAKMFGPGLPVSTHLLLAALIHLGYGGFWGAILFALARRVTLWNGLAMGAFLYLGSHIFLSPLLARGDAAGGPLRIASWLSWFSIATHFTYGATLGLLGSWQDRAQRTRLETEKSELQVGSPRPVTPR
ncbi:MAG TPA: hypothetical protein VNE63_03935 [Candidatus Acidoferrales bacterium]|nr:hypothetical protein [Candidatus Acidoferrales bacterium]